jgi:hypothetical protein
MPWNDVSHLFRVKVPADDGVAAIEQDAGDTFLIRAEPRGDCDVLFPESVDLFRVSSVGTGYQLERRRPGARGSAGTEIEAAVGNG